MILPRILTLPFLATLALGSSGCGLFDLLEPETTLADLDPAIARVEVELGESPRVSLVLVAKEGTCEAITDDVKAKVDDRKMDLFIRGGETPTQDGWVCGAPTFRKALAEENLGKEKTHFEVSDESARIALDFEDLLAERTIAPSHPQDKIEPGVDLALAWSAPGDEFAEDDIDVVFTYDDATLELPAPPQVSVVDREIVVRIPQGSPPGPATLRVDAEVHVAAASCNGTESCEATVKVSPEVALEVTSGVVP
ncbi:hypothetical protein [Polyangium sp. y55x31]|uniref:hypothetical protein n=1 Tax=Polyangium sp. y55x31 TaxID=3042688 RepID=UPI00248290E7|nr:hypothetical protein [Polyangium sp. y55x31]MDI1475184.1 hypothetical protein [Polyangium sp. y55x31]